MYCILLGMETRICCGNPANKHRIDGMGNQIVSKRKTGQARRC